MRRPLPKQPQVLAYLCKCGDRDVTITDSEEEAALLARDDPMLDEFGGTKVGTSLPPTVRAFWEQTGYTCFPPVTELDLDDEAFVGTLRTAIQGEKISDADMERVVASDSLQSNTRECKTPFVALESPFSSRILLVIQHGAPGTKYAIMSRTASYKKPDLPAYCFSYRAFIGTGQPIFDRKPSESELVDGMNSLPMCPYDNGIVPRVLGGFLLTQLSHIIKKLLPDIQTIHGKVTEGIYDFCVGRILGAPLVSQGYFFAKTEQFPPPSIIKILPPDVRVDRSIQLSVANGLQMNKITQQNNTETTKK